MASLNPDEIRPAPSDSITPSSRPPITAPGRLVSPPMTAATKPLSPSISPMS